MRSLEDGERCCINLELLIPYCPSLIAIILSVLSFADPALIKQRVENDPRTPRADVSIVADIANGAATFSLHIANVFLFMAGSMIAILGWRVKTIPILVSTILFIGVISHAFHVLTKPLSELDRAGYPASAPPLAYQLRFVQIGCNLVIIALIYFGQYSG